MGLDARPNVFPLKSCQCRAKTQQKRHINNEQKILSGICIQHITPNLLPFKGKRVFNTSGKHLLGGGK
ncbi:MAG TPA: hypothetical protein DCF33_14055 [Saprospirales bacterium]|nr:hypothetical protein [Saprospirales bacterium]